MPREFVYIETARGTDVSLWLLDLVGGSPPTAVAAWTGGESFSASHDGRTVVIMARGSRSPLALHLLRPLRGDARILFEGETSISRAVNPRVSPDGRWVAFALSGPTAEGGWDGVWMLEIETGKTRQLLSQPSGETSPVFLAGWSDDGRHLTYTHYEPSARTADGRALVVHDLETDERWVVGAGHLVSWRAQEPRLLFAHVGGKGSQGAFGATFQTYDLGRQQRQELASIDPRAIGLAWSPAQDGFLYLTETMGCQYRAQIWTRTTAGVAQRVGVIETANEAWWSADGSTVYALVQGAGADADLVDGFSGRKIATIPNAVRTWSCP